MTNKLENAFEVKGKEQPATWFSLPANAIMPIF